MIIIGASGSIGNRLYYEAVKSNINVIGTQFKTSCKEYIKFDMLQQDIRQIDSLFEKSMEKKIAVICAADSNIELCQLNYINAYKKNVIATKKILDDLEGLGYYSIFLSSDSVFDGVNGDYYEESIRNPINQYGTMKKIIEDYIIEKYPDNCVLRLGKVVGEFNHKRDIFNEWFTAASNKNTIYCIKENYFSPISIEDVIKCILITAKLKLKGLYNISGSKKYKRSDLCNLFLKEIGMEYKVEEKQLSDFNFKEPRPLNTVMKNGKFIGMTDIKFQTMEMVIKKFIQYKQMLEVLESEYNLKLPE